MSYTATGPKGSCCSARGRAATRGRIRITTSPVFIKDPGSLSAELHRLASVSTDILLDTGAVISAKPFLAGAYRERTGFMQELRRDGIDL